MTVPSQQTDLYNPRSDSLTIEYKVNISPGFSIWHQSQGTEWSKTSMMH